MLRSPSRPVRIARPPRVAPLYALVIALVVAALQGCASMTPGSATATASPRLMHTVVFWLKDDAPADTAAAMATFYRERVPTLPGVERVFIGTPRPSERSVVDDGFTLCASTLFRDAAAEVAWQSDPLHDELKARFDRWIERVVVYDAVEPARR